MKRTLQVIAAIEILGSGLLVFGLIDLFYNSLISGQFVSALMVLFLLIGSAILGLGGYWLWHFKEKGFLLSIIGLVFQALYLTTPFLKYYMFSPFAFVLNLSTNGGLGTAIYISSDYSFSIFNELQYSEFGINIVAVILLGFLFQPYLVMRKHGRLPRKLKCKNCNNTFGWNVEYKEQEIKCEYCSEVTKFEKEPHG